MPACAALGPVERRRCGARVYAVRRIGDVDVYVMKTGMGPAAASDAARRVLSDVALDAILSTGYVGALGAADIGDVIVGTDVQDWTSPQAGTIFHADAGLLATACGAADEAAVTWTDGLVATVPRVLCRADEKRTVADASGAIAVDMESAAIAHEAALKQVPFLMVRAVSDRADETLPMDFNLWLTPGERLRAMAQLVSRPAMLFALWQMKRQADQASQSLTGFFQAWWRLLEQAPASPMMPAPALRGATIAEPRSMGAH